jgi:hypothetical protein
MLAQLRKRIYQRLWDRVPQGEIAPKWLIAARLALLPIDTIKLLVMDQYYDIWTNTWKINGVRMSGQMIAVMTAEIDEGRWHRFVRQGDLVTVETLFSSDIEDETKNPWKAAVIEHLVCCFLLNEENSKDPKKALHDILSWETQLALDPLISERARKLLQMRPEDYTDD